MTELITTLTYATFIAKNTDNTLHASNDVKQIFEDLGFVKDACVSLYKYDIYNNTGSDYGGTKYKNYSFLIIGELQPKFAELYAFLLSSKSCVSFSNFTLSKLQ